MPVQFPDQEEGLPDELAVRLFRMSSVLPDASRSLAASLDLAMNSGSRGFVFNADMTSLVQFLDIGTRGPSNMDVPSANGSDTEDPGGEFSDEELH